MKTISNRDKVKCRRAVMRTPKTPKPSFPKLMMEMFRELREDKFVEHSEIGNSVYIPFEKRPKNYSKCCPDGQVLAKTAPDASSPIKKLGKTFSNRQRSLIHTEKRNRGEKSPGSNACRTRIRYGSHVMSCFVIGLKLLRVFLNWGFGEH